MDALEVILSRRSIRIFNQAVIKDEDLKLILKAGFAAPSAHNRQPWHFVVIKDESVLNNMATQHPYAKMLPKAGCGIVVCGDSEKQKATGFIVEDCSAAIENMLLAAHALNLGAVWCGIYPVPELTKMVSELLDLPETIIPVGLIAVGEKAEEKLPRDNYDETKIHFNKW